MTHFSKQPAVESKGRPWVTSARNAALGLSALGAMALAPAVQGAAMFTSSTNLTLTFEVIAGNAADLFMDVDVALFNDVLTLGGSAQATSSATVDDGLGFVQSASATDTVSDGLPAEAFVGPTPVFDGATVAVSAATNGTGGVAFADSLNDISIFIDNFFGLTDATVRLTWGLSQTATAFTANLGETAQGSSSFSLFGDSVDAAGNIVPAFPDVIQDVNAIAFDGSVDSSGLVQTSGFVDIVVAANGGFNASIALVDAFGNAFGVPEPTTLGLLGIGLLGMGFSSRRRRSKVLNR